MIDYRPLASPEEFLLWLRQSSLGDMQLRDDELLGLVQSFRQTFYGDPAGRRVLYAMFYWAGMFRPAPMDPNALQRTEGARELCYRVMAMLNAELPRTPPSYPQQEETDRGSSV